MIKHSLPTVASRVQAERRQNCAMFRLVKLTGQFISGTIGAAAALLTGVFWVADCEGAPPDLLLKQVLLVEEQDDGCVREPLVVADGVKQLHALVHPVLETSFREHASHLRHSDHYTIINIHLDLYTIIY
jgi:hypothetical protein